MKTKVILTVLSVILVVALMGTPVFAKDNQNNGQPFQELWDAIIKLQDWVASFVVSWTDIVGIPTDIADGDDVGITSESDPTVDPSVKDGVGWNELSGIPADIADGDQGVTSESDPTVLASVKDGVSWGELSGIPGGFADGIDNVGGDGTIVKVFEMHGETLNWNESKTWDVHNLGGYDNVHMEILGIVQETAGDAEHFHHGEYFWYTHAGVIKKAVIEDPTIWWHTMALGPQHYSIETVATGSTIQVRVTNVNLWHAALGTHCKIIVRYFLP
jgi:hypothetical protein